MNDNEQRAHDIAVTLMHAVAQNRPTGSMEADTTQQRYFSLYSSVYNNALEYFETVPNSELSELEDGWLF